MNNNDNNPFQMKQQEENDNVFEVNNNTDANIATPQKPVIALDGVSPQYNDEYSFPMPSENEAFIPVATEAYTETDITDFTPEFTPPNSLTDNTDINNETTTEDPNLINNDKMETDSLYQPTEITPSLEDPDKTAIEINPKSKKKASSNPGKVKTWLFVVASSIALIGVTGAVFFMIEYNQANASLTELHGQIQEYRSQAESGQAAMQQLESLQSTVQEQAEKITSLKEENDSMKKTKDELKSAKEEIEKLKKEKEELVNNYAKMLPNSNSNNN